jgi:IS4 transposase
LIFKLYRLRWQVETSFLELTAITRSEQWHSKSYNGIMQELYALMWLINATRGLIVAMHLKVRTLRGRPPASLAA